MNRRSFLQSSGAAAVAPWVNVHATAQTAAPHDSAFDPWVEVHPAYLAQNAAEVSRAAGNRPILAVVKNNGYGLGVVRVGEVLAKLPQVRGLAVVKLHEAMTLRDAGIKAPILLMGPFNERDLADMHRWPNPAAKRKRCCSRRSASA